MDKYFWPMVPFFGFILLGLFTGVVKGGDSRMAFFELRALFYLPATYLIFRNTIQTKEQLQRVGWVVLLSMGVESILGTWTYFFILNGDVTGVNEITDHQVAIFLNLLFLFVIAQGFYGGLKRQALFALACCRPP